MGNPAAELKHPLLRLSFIELGIGIASLVCNVLFDSPLGISCDALVMASSIICITGSWRKMEWVLLVGSLLGFMIVGLYIAALVILVNKIKYFDFSSNFLHFYEKYLNIN